MREYTGFRPKTQQQQKTNKNNKKNQLSKHNKAKSSHSPGHTPSIAFRHLPPDSARFGYATEGTLFYLCAAVQRRDQRPPKGSGTNMTVEAT